ncbi:MAG: hypothetical protein FWC95_08015 [Defluviitaleaceae bacterium]|nr:hypothetical protein [Defluviitaleaceae bacterium]
MTNIKRLCALLLALFLVAAIPVSALSMELTSFTYNRVGRGRVSFMAYVSPNPYRFVRSVTADDLRFEDGTGVQSLALISYLFVTDDRIFVANGEHIIVTDHDFNPLYHITGMYYNGEWQEFSGTTHHFGGIFVTENGDIFATQTGVGRTIHWDSDFNVIRVLGRPANMPPMVAHIEWAPWRIVVDRFDRIYIVARNITEGIIELHPDGSFSRFFGQVPVVFTLRDAIAQRFQSRQQRAAARRHVPTTFLAMALDNDGFFYTVNASMAGDARQLRKINTRGTDVLRPMATPTGDVFPQGDFNINTFARGSGASVGTGHSSFIAVDVNDFGVFIALDETRNRIFAYDSEGYMLFAFGAQGRADGNFMNPWDIAFLGDNQLIVTDRTKRSIEIFELTSYGEAIFSAIYLQHNFQFDAARDMWERVLAYNQNFHYAYIGIGMSQLRAREFDAAMESFRRGQSVHYFSRAFAEVRNDFFNEYFLIVAGIVIAFPAYKITRRFFWKKKPKTDKRETWYSKLKENFITFPFYIIRRPFKAFEEIKLYDKGKFSVVVTIFIALGIQSLLTAQFLGFVARGYYVGHAVTPVNVLGVILFAMIPVLLFCVANWSVTTLTNGNGKFKHIVYVYAYALYPQILLNIIGLILTNFLTETEIVFATFLMTAGTVMTFFYLFLGIIVVHEYTLFRAIFTIICTIIAMAIIVFIFGLLISMTGDVYGFFETIFLELRMR